MISYKNFKAEFRPELKLRRSLDYIIANDDLIANDMTWKPLKSVAFGSNSGHINIEEHVVVTQIIILFAR